MNRQSQKTDATRQAFVDAFCGLCESMPIDRITVNALTKKAGYNRSTFYAYFTGIQELLEHIEYEVILFVRNNLFTTIENIGVAEKFIEMFTEDVNDIQNRYIGILLLTPVQINFAAHLKDALLPAFMANFNIADNDYKAKYALDYHISGMISMMTRWVTNGRDISVEVLGEAVQSVMTRGVLGVLGNK